MQQRSSADLAVPDALNLNGGGVLGAQIIVRQLKGRKSRGRRRAVKGSQGLLVVRKAP
jgi:hypothetical protein